MWSPPELLIEDLIVDLVEHPSRTITRRDLPRWGNAGATLLRWGGLRQGETLTSVACDACGNDHFVELEFDPDTRAWHYYCSCVGIVSVQADQLISYVFDLGWLTARLVDLLTIQRPEMACLIDGVMWRLGTARLGTTFWTVALVRDVDRQLNRILEQVQLAGRNHPGLLISSTHPVPWRVTLPNDYRWLSLKQLLRVADDELAVHETAIEDALRTRKQRTGSQGKAGRPGAQDSLLEELHRRAVAGEMLGTVSAEARHLAAWLGQSPRSIAREPGSVRNSIRDTYNKLKANSPRNMK